MTDTPSSITRQLVAEDQRMEITAALFGVNFPLHLEPFVFFMADTICEEYNGGYGIVKGDGHCLQLNL